jgi:hypothetical protein
MDEDGSEQWEWWMVKTADDNKNGEWFMRRVDKELLMRRRDTVSCYYFYGSLQGFYTMV